MKSIQVRSYAAVTYYAVIKLDYRRNIVVKVHVGYIFLGRIELYTRAAYRSKAYTYTNAIESNIYHCQKTEVETLFFFIFLFFFYLILFFLVAFLFIFERSECGKMVSIFRVDFFFFFLSIVKKEKKNLALAKTLSIVKACANYSISGESMIYFFYLFTVKVTQIAILAILFETVTS